MGWSIGNLFAPTAAVSVIITVYLVSKGPVAPGTGESKLLSSKQKHPSYREQSRTARRGKRTREGDTPGYLCHESNPSRAPEVGNRRVPVLPCPDGGIMSFLR